MFLNSIGPSLGNDLFWFLVLPGETFARLNTGFQQLLHRIIKITDLLFVFTGNLENIAIEKQSADIVFSLTNFNLVVTSLGFPFFSVLKFCPATLKMPLLLDLLLLCLGPLPISIS